MDYKQLIRHIAKALVDNARNVSVKQISGVQTTVLELKVAKEDVGKIIGKQGRTADAIRHLLHSAATKNRDNVLLEIID
ncbi:MAG: KH domain-containing protein [Desulfobacteraceae bacterium]|nr:KH domain-containing protein [Desulfobacteraceae bacterium]